MNRAIREILEQEAPRNWRDVRAQANLDPARVAVHRDALEASIDPPLAVLTTAVLSARGIQRRRSGLPIQMRLGVGLIALLVCTHVHGDDLICGMPTIADVDLGTYEYRIEVTPRPLERGGFWHAGPTRRWGVATLDRFRWWSGW